MCACVFYCFHDKKCPQGIFPITTSLLKLANHAMHGNQTWYTCVFQRFHDNHEQKRPQALFPVTTSSLLKLAHLTSETWYTCAFQRFQEQKIASDTFLCNTFFTSQTCKPCNSETWYTSRFHDSHEQNGLGHFLSKKDFFTSQTCNLYSAGYTEKVTLRMHVHFSISMTTMNQKWPQAFFYITTSSLLQLAIYTMHEDETDFNVSMRAIMALGSFL